MAAWVEKVGEWERGDRESLPSPASLDLLFGLLHGTNNAAALLDLADEVSEALAGVEERIRERAPGLAGAYTGRLGLVIVGFLRAHFAYALLCPDQLAPIALRLVKLVSLPSSLLPSSTARECPA